MFFYPKQEVIKIGNVVLGGQPADNPAVMIGTIFYEGHKAVKKNASSGYGEIDKRLAEKLINMQIQKSEETGIQRMMNIYGNCGEELIKRIEFFVEHDDAPFLVDSPNYMARISAFDHIANTGLIDRAIYNSINITLNKEEKEKLKELKLKNALILAHSVNERSIEEKIDCLEKNGALGMGLINNAFEIGAKNLMIDTATTPLNQGAALSLSAIITLKSKFGYPVGCGIHNAVSSWSWLKKRDSFKFVDIASSSLPLILGADFVLYGPIENATHIFSLAKFVQILIEENAQYFG